MNFARLGRLALAAATAMIGVGTAHAQSQEAIERSGNTFHQAVCARAIGRGEARCFAHVVTDARGNPMPGKPDAAAPNVVPSGYGSADLRSAYLLTATGNSATTIAIVDAYGYAKAEADLATYRTQMNLPPCTTANGCLKVVDQRGGNALPRYNSGWAQEQALDLDMASAMCPNCKILLVQSDTPSFVNLGVAVNTAATLGAAVISNSYGGGEASSAPYNSYYVHPGVAVTASSGDSGYGASFPASSPDVIAVGGTNLKRSSGGRGWTELAWTSAGSGCSAVYAKPSWQTDTLCTTRVESDISAVADPATGVAVYGPSSKGTQSAWLVFGGTSVSAPLIGGIYGALGARPTAARKIWMTAPTGLNDVTSGSNGSCGGTYFCTAGPGYDGPTGNGTPAGAAAF